MALFLWIILGCLIALLILLAVPVELSFSVSLQAGRRAVTGRVIWLFGLVRLAFPGKAESKSRHQPKPGQKKSRRPSKKGRSSPMGALSVEGFIGSVLTLVRRLLAAIHIRHLTVRARLGLDDPADTGRLWAVMGPVSALLALPKAARIDIEPDFADQVLMFTGDGHIRVVPLELLILVLVFLLSPKTLRAYWAMRPRA